MHMVSIDAQPDTFRGMSALEPHGDGVGRQSFNTRRYDKPYIV